MAVKKILTVHIQYNHNKTERSLYQWSSYCPVKYMSHIMGCLQCPVLVLFYARGFPILWIFLFSSVSFSLYDSVLVSVFPLRLQTLLYSILRKLCWIDLFHNGGQIKYSFVLMLISPTSLATTSKFQKNICFKTRAVGLINI